ncbi:hypothetical protein WME79_49935 [Sorangium sp. So ce726]|uniref:hypothetical protein n=1 Tax=Sorangium sp. So ce726 TaxID=3133319 RepID=UPI003F629272
MPRSGDPSPRRARLREAAAHVGSRKKGRRKGKSGAPVALKLLEARLRREPKVKARFLLEAMVVHPNIVEVLDIGLHEGSPYLVLEFLFGESLSSLP